MILKHLDRNEIPAVIPHETRSVADRWRRHDGRELTNGKPRACDKGRREMLRGWLVKVEGIVKRGEVGEGRRRKRERRKRKEKEDGRGKRMQMKEAGRDIFILFFSKGDWAQREYGCECQRYCFFLPT